MVPMLPVLRSARPRHAVEALGCLVLLVSACEPGRQRVGVDLALDAHPAAPAPPEDGPLSAITLTEATLTLDDLVLRSEEGSVAAAGPRTGRSMVAWLGRALVPAAHAHPGHGDDDTVVGEWLGPVTVDLLEGASLGPAVVFEGPVDTVDLTVSAVRLQGEAMVGGTSVPLSLDVALEDRITGVSVSGVVVEDGGPGLVLSASLGDWVAALPLDEAGSAGLDDDTPGAAEALCAAVRGRSTWTLEPLP